MWSAAPKRRLICTHLFNWFVFVPRCAPNHGSPIPSFCPLGTPRGFLKCRVEPPGPKANNDTGILPTVNEGYPFQSAQRLQKAQRLLLQEVWLACRPKTMNGRTGSKHNCQMVGNNEKALLYIICIVISLKLGFKWRLGQSESISETKHSKHTTFETGKGLPLTRRRGF